MQHPTGTSSSMSGEIKFQFKEDFTLYQDPNDNEKSTCLISNLITKGNLQALREIIMNIYMIGTDRGILFNPKFIFGDAINTMVEACSQYNGKEGAIYALPNIEHYYPLYYLKPYIENGDGVEHHTRTKIFNKERFTKTGLFRMVLPLIWTSSSRIDSKAHTCSKSPNENLNFQKRICQTEV